MAFRYNAFSEKLTNNPTEAHAQLVGLFEKHECRTADIAEELGTTTVTLWRWIGKLTDQGFPNPGANRRARGKGKKAAVR